MVDPTWLSWLLLAASWTTFFSMFTAPAVRGYRNLGWIACYLLGLLMLFFVGWRSAVWTWGAVGLASGALYYLYEMVGHARNRAEADRPALRAVVDGLFLWPIMLPEVVEYALADLKILKTRTEPGVSVEGESTPAEDHPSA